jgi:polysaccharide export outer membrane protein
MLLTAALVSLFGYGLLVAAADKPAPPAAALQSIPAAYRIGPGDVLQIDVWKEPDASYPAVTVRPDGRISLPILGELMVAGMTPADLETVLTEKFAKFIRTSRVVVGVREPNSQRIYVIGEVRREGSIRLMAPMTVVQALAEAGGVTDYAKRKKIYILRSQNGRQQNLPFDYDAVLRGQKVVQNVLLLSGDTIVVPR